MSEGPVASEPPHQLVIADACSLQNFAIVDRLSTLTTRFGADLHWTEAVEHETGRGLRAEPALQRVLDLSPAVGGPLRLDGPGDLEAVDLIRRGLGGASTTPLQHLGEAGRSERSRHLLPHVASSSPMTAPQQRLPDAVEAA